MVYILNKDGSPLMPTERHGKVRRLLRDGKAHVVRVKPFTIQLDYQTTSYVQADSLGVDADSAHVSESATKQSKELVCADVVKTSPERLYRRNKRRYRKTKHRSARSDNGK